MLIEAVRDRAHLRSMGLAGRRKALEFFDWNRAVRIMFCAIDGAVLGCDYLSGTTESLFQKGPGNHA